MEIFIFLDQNLAVSILSETGAQVTRTGHTIAVSINPTADSSIFPSDLPEYSPESNHLLLHNPVISCLLRCSISESLRTFQKSICVLIRLIKAVTDTSVLIRGISDISIEGKILRQKGNTLSDSSSHTSQEINYFSGVEIQKTYYGYY